MIRPLVLIALLAGCSATLLQRVPIDGPDAQGYRWVQDGPVGNPVIHRGADVYLNCDFEDKALSCAVQNGDGNCDIYLPDDALAWQEAHERRHCAGWTHPNVLKGF